MEDQKKNKKVKPVFELPDENTSFEGNEKVFVPLEETAGTLPNNIMIEQNNLKMIKKVPNPLRKERIIVRHINKHTWCTTSNNPRHVLSGGMASQAVKVYTVPRLSSGQLVNVLTDDEKTFLEQILNLEVNELSIYRVKDNFWKSSQAYVRLTKQDNILDLSDPMQYIQYKILLANKDYIAPSKIDYENTPKATYEFIIINENEELKLATNTMNAITASYKEYDKISQDSYKLRYLIEFIENRPLSPKTKLDFLQIQINKVIQEQPKTFLTLIKDSLLEAKILLKKSVEKGLIFKRGNSYYTKDNIPMCETGQEPTLNNAANYINNPKNQDLLFNLQSKTED